MSARVIASETLLRQRQASDPQGSAWVSAHAGSGKTHVLASRVVRLLLAGAAPAQILCLTYTKAAAANMSARIFGVLARWTQLDDDALRREIEDMGARAPARVDLEFARRLFARAVETPGGLKIQTIHAFCEKLLHLFPFEANVPAGFRVVDDVAQAELMEAARRHALHRATRDEGPLRDALGAVARDARAAGFDALSRELLGHRGALAQPIDADYARRLRRRLGLRADETLARIETQIIAEGEPPSEWPALAAALSGGGANDGKLGGALLRAHALAPSPEGIDAYFSVFFTKDGQPRGAAPRSPFISAQLATRMPMLRQRMETERDRLAPLREKRKAAATADRSLALAMLGDAILADYAQAKRYRGLLDYDDLIEGARRLLNRSSPSWVLYKLDSQIEHILLDEAQDTSAAQWDILSAIADEFCAGAGVYRKKRGPPRSFFAVGDEKQSIFSFQGAAPEKFDSMRRDFSQRFEAVARPFHWVRLTQSFRSAPGVLAAVDDVFAFGDNRMGLSSDPLEPPPRHEACKTQVAALIEIWEPLGPQKNEEPQDWRLPLDLASRSDPTERLAQKIARKIAALLAPGSGECVDDHGELRATRPGDILILVRKRGALFEAINRALKAAHVPVAGADRLNLTEHIAVNDLVAIGRAALLPQDDLTLAAALKSPIFGLTDEDLLGFAPRRAASLYEALGACEDLVSRAATQRLEALRADVQHLAPFDFYSRLLGPGGGRRAFLARLGSEANDAVDEFLRLALAFEREHGPSLTRFLAMVESLDVSIKRDMETASGAVRVMTAHAAKGLEAKIVFLPDTCGAPTGKHDPKLHAIGDDAPVLLWSLRKESDPPALSAAREGRRQAERAEHQRLLYVALTRAEERVYIAGCHGANGRGAGCWYDALRNALEPSCDVLPDPLTDGANILRRGAAPVRRDLAREETAAPPRAVPAFARTPAPYEKASAPPLRPSSPLAGADAYVADDEAPRARAAAERLLIGRLTHALLQYLPTCAPSERAEAARRFIAARGAAFDEAQGVAQGAAIVQAALRVIDDPRLAPLYGPESMAEVDIVATIAGGLAVSGRIDRLAVTEAEAIIAEYKSGRPQLQSSPAQLRQLALYRAAVSPLYPEKRVRALLVYTQSGAVLEPADAALDDALAAALREA